MPRSRDEDGRRIRTAKERARPQYVPRDARRHPCSRCHVFADEGALISGLGPEGRFCQACWAEACATFAPRLALGETLDRYYQRKYGITLDEYGVRFLRQKGKCAICLAKPGEEPLAVDHDHATGAVRGLLCRGCNVGLGFFRDETVSLARAIVYLQEST